MTVLRVLHAIGKGGSKDAVCAHAWLVDGGAWDGVLRLPALDLILVAPENSLGIRGALSGGCALLWAHLVSEEGSGRLLVSLSLHLSVHLVIIDSEELVQSGGTNWLSMRAKRKSVTKSTYLNFGQTKLEISAKQKEHGNFCFQYVGLTNFATDCLT